MQIPLVVEFILFSYASSLAYFNDSASFDGSHYFTSFIGLAKIIARFSHSVSMFQDIPGGLPPAYQKATVQRIKSIDTWRAYIRKNNLTKEQKRSFELAVEARFQV